jgi:hypothetical protein
MRLLCAAIGLLLGLLAWSPGLSGPYLFDDSVTPLSDPASQSLSAWGINFSKTLRPVTKITYAIEADAGLLHSPWIRRCVSLLFHLVAAVLLFFLILRLEPKISFFVAALISAIWLLHPVHADGVLFISGRTAAMSGMFVLASMLAFEKDRSLLAAILFLLAILSRETAFAAILPLVVLEVTKQESQDRWRRLIPVIVAAAVGFLWCLAIPRYRELADYSFLGRPLIASTLNQVAAVPVGLGLLLAPNKLSIDYGIPLASTKLFILGLIFYFAAIAGILLLKQKSRATAIGLALGVAALLPTQSVIPKLDALTNRPLTLALAGLLLALTPIISRIRFPKKSILSWSFGICSILLLLLLTHATARRSTLFQSEIALWRDAASKSTVNARPHLQCVVLLQRQGRHQEALEELTIAREIDPFSSRIDALWKAYTEGTR